MKRIQYRKVITPTTGNKYSISWAKPGCTWVCTEVHVKTGWVKMKTPKSAKEIWVKIDSLRELVD